MKLFLLPIIASVMILSGCMHTSNPTSTSTYLPPVDDMNIHMCLMGGGHDCDIILDPANQSTYATAIQAQCDAMKGMKKCDEYFAQ